MRRLNRKEIINPEKHSSGHRKIEKAYVINLTVWLLWVLDTVREKLQVTGDERERG